MTGSAVASAPHLLSTARFEDIDVVRSFARRVPALRELEHKRYSGCEPDGHHTIHLALEQEHVTATKPLDSNHHIREVFQNLCRSFNLDAAIANHSRRSGVVLERQYPVVAHHRMIRVRATAWMPLGPSSRTPRVAPPWTWDAAIAASVDRIVGCEINRLANAQGVACDHTARVVARVRHAVPDTCDVTPVLLCENHHRELVVAALRARGQHCYDCDTRFRCLCDVIASVVAL